MDEWISVNGMRFSGIKICDTHGIPSVDGLPKGPLGFGVVTTTPGISDISCYCENQMFITHLLPSSNLLKTTSPPPLKHFTQIMGANF